MDKYQKNRIAIYPNDELRKAIEKGAEKECRSLSNYINQILHYFHFENSALLGLNKNKFEHAETEE